MLLAQILGGILGLTVAWLMNRAYESYQDRKLEKLHIQHQIELENYKKTLRKNK